MSALSVLLHQAEQGLPEALRERYFADSCAAGVHLAVMREPYLSYLLNGSKTIESRFSVNRVDPFDRVSEGDLVLLKAGPVLGAFVVGSVEFKDVVSEGLERIRVDYNARIRASDDFWDLKSSARFGTLIRVDELVTFPPFSIDKRDMRGWVVLRERKDELALIW